MAGGTGQTNSPRSAYASRRRNLAPDQERLRLLVLPAPPDVGHQDRRPAPADAGQPDLDLLAPLHLARHPQLNAVQGQLLAAGREVRAEAHRPFRTVNRDALLEGLPADDPPVVGRGSFFSTSRDPAKCWTAGERAADCASVYEGWVASA